MESIFIIFLAILFLIGFVFILKDYYKEKDAYEKKQNISENNPNNQQIDQKSSLEKPPKFIATNRELIYVIAISILVVLVLIESLFGNILLKRCSYLRNENNKLSKEITQLKESNSASPSSSTNDAFEKEMEQALDFAEKMIELYEKLDH